MERRRHDLATVRALCKGDGPGFERFFDDVFPPLYRHVLTQASGDDVAAREITERTLVRAIERLDEYGGDESLIDWLCRIAHEVELEYCAPVTRRISRSRFQELLRNVVGPSKPGRLLHD